MNLGKNFNIIYVIILYSKPKKKTIMISDVTISDPRGTSQNGGRICRCNDCVGLCETKSRRYLAII